MYNTLNVMPDYYKAGIYIRLSEADEGKSYESESESVLNQRNILMNFIKEKGFIFVDEYVDDGYSGTTFDRPGFQRLIEDVKAKRINLVIVKDLSRLGRDHILTGYYVDENGIEYWRGIPIESSVATIEEQEEMERILESFREKEEDIK